MNVVAVLVHRDMLYPTNFNDAQQIEEILVIAE
jgi:hypothetical protein